MFSKKNFLLKNSRHRDLRPVRKWSLLSGLILLSLLFSYQNCANSNFPPLVISQDNSTVPQIQELVLGQPDFLGIDPGLGSGTLSMPQAVTSQGESIILADSGNSRILIWSYFPQRAGQPADIVLGQPNMNTSFNSCPSDQNPSGHPDDRSFCHPAGVATNGTLFAMSDSEANRLLIWDHIPTVNQDRSQFVVGQADFASTSPNGASQVPTSRGIFNPSGICINSTYLYASDANNNRVLGWRLPIQQNFPQADFVLGQPDFTTSQPNNIVNKAQSLNNPQGLSCDDHFLSIADCGNHRILLWSLNLPPSQMSPTTVIGQSNFQTLSLSPLLTSETLKSPTQAFVFQGKLVISDTGNNRVLFYKTLPSNNGAPADSVFGQPDFNSFQPNNPLMYDSSQFLNNPSGVALTKTSIVIVDQLNNRVLLIPWGGL